MPSKERKRKQLLKIDKSKDSKNKGFAKNAKGRKLARSKSFFIPLI